MTEAPTACIRFLGSDGVAQQLPSNQAHASPDEHASHSDLCSHDEASVYMYIHIYT